MHTEVVRWRVQPTTCSEELAGEVSERQVIAAPDEVQLLVQLRQGHRAERRR
jgi:hypothetical protein